MYFKLKLLFKLSVKEIEGVLFVNPGQGYKSFMVDCTMAQLTVNSGNITAEIIVIENSRS